MKIRLESTEQMLKKARYMLKFEKSERASESHSYMMVCYKKTSLPLIDTIFQNESLGTQKGALPYLREIASVQLVTYERIVSGNNAVYIHTSPCI